MKIGSLDTTRINLSGWLLRLGLAFVFAYAGISSLQHPPFWIGYLPNFLTSHWDAKLLLKGFAVVELVIAVWLLSGKFVRYAAAAAALMLAGIVVFNPHQLLITFRDVGLVAMALALMVA